MSTWCSTWTVSAASVFSCGGSGCGECCSPTDAGRGCLLDFAVLCLGLALGGGSGRWYGRPPCVVHFLLREAGANGGLWTLSPPGVTVDVLLAQPQPGVPVGVLLAQPLHGVLVSRRHHHRRPVHLQLHGRPGSVVSRVILGVEVPVAGPQSLLPGPRWLRVRWASGGCMGSGRFRERRCVICERSGVVG